MKEVISAFSQKDFAEMAIVVIMSHGNDGFLVGSDDISVYHKDILGKFDGRNPKLKGKPKLFVFAHCR
jgi:hypothetical protein